MTLDANGSKVGELRYRQYGSVRYTWGVTPTDFRYIGQRLETTGVQLYDYDTRCARPP